MMQYSSHSENYSSSPSKWSSPKESKGFVYKASSYQYGSSGGTGSSFMEKSGDQNIDQLDALLEDLRNERQISRDKEHLPPSSNYRTLERSVAEEPAGTVSRTTRVIKTTRHTGVDDTDNFPTSDYSTLRSSGTLVRNDYQVVDKSYGGSKPQSPGGFYDSKSQFYESNRTLEKPELVPVSTTPTSATHLEKDLENIALTDDILPIPGTKVTTTVRTYTYEIPANAAATTNTIGRKNILYNPIQSNEGSSVVQPHPLPNIPQTVVYNTESYSTLNRGSEKPVVTNQIYEVRNHYESNTSRTSALPPPRNVPGGPQPDTVVYNINNTTTTTTDRPNYPPHSPNRSPQVPIGGPHSPPQGPTTHHYYYKESTNTVNTIHGPRGPTEPHGPKEVALVPQRPPVGYHPQTDGYPPNVNPPPNSTITYKYSTTTMGPRPGPDYGTPSSSMPPAPFPIDGVDYPATTGNPPQRVDDLMQSLGNTDVVDRSDLNTPRKREIETAVASPNQQIIPSVNRAGKEVYYPPGHDMMLAKREEMRGGSAAGGRWAKGSGMYEYESGYKSKSKTKTSGAMVPVCLPLCCAMPCSIM